MPQGIMGIYDYHIILQNVQHTKQATDPCPNYCVGFVGKQRLMLGPLMGGPQFRKSILRNGNVACLRHLFSTM